MFVESYAGEPDDSNMAEFAVPTLDNLLNKLI